MASAVQTSDMGRPKSEQPKQSVISLRTFDVVRQRIEEHARREHRTLAQMAELLLREALIARGKREKESTTDIENLP